MLIEQIIEFELMGPRPPSRLKSNEVCLKSVFEKRGVFEK